jgi:methyl-accepting chemotaxis protein
MLRKLNIGPRLLALIGVQAMLLLAIGGLTLLVVRFSLDTTESLNQKVAQEARLIALSDSLRSDLVGSIHEVNAGAITWTEAKQNLGFARREFDAGWKEFLITLDETDLELANEVLAPHVEGVREVFDTLAPLMESQDRSLLSLFVTNDLDFLVGPFLNALVARTAQQQLEAEVAVATATARGQQFALLGTAGLGVGIVLAVLLGFAIYRSISRPLGAIAATVQQVSAGDFEARTQVSGSDELGALGIAFDTMLNDRLATLSRAQVENDRLNHSVISLLEAVSKLSQRDLRVKVPVTEDVTGPVADSLNLLTDETAKVLKVVQIISENVADASNEVRLQSERVIQVANQEQVEVAATASELSSASEQMVKIARLAQACAQAADKAIGSTQTAMQTVTGTVGGINSIRDTIREAEKRIKRLGERSQEISGVVSLINTIAERTHILALNASMHAASAGEAGRGFAVVADEVQRLAENARDATSQISTLVNNIQLETSDTVATMNEVISQVVSGSQLAEQAGERMEETRESTENLVSMVRQIASGSRLQAKTSMALKRRAEGIEKTTRDTSQQLAEQSAHTVALVEHASRLVAAVKVFQLPEVDPTDTLGGGSPGPEVQTRPIAVSA